MPLSINVGLSRKASKDYQSTGYSINVTAELDQALLARPQELQKQIEALYQQAGQALDRQACPPVTQAEPSPDRPSGNGNGSAHAQPVPNSRRVASGNGHHSSNGRNGSGMTASQRRAIEAIARRLNVDHCLESRDMIGAEFDQLSIRQASELIDHLKSLQATENGRNGGGR